MLLFRKELNVWRTLKFSNRGAGRKASPMCPGCVHRGIDKNKQTTKNIDKENNYNEVYKK